MYISDYMYGASPTYWNYPGYSSSGATYDYRAAKTYDWLFNSQITWTASPYSSYANSAWHVYPFGVLGGGSAANGYAVRPVFSLSSNVEIDTSATSTEGSASHPYILRAE